MGLAGCMDQLEEAREGESSGGWRQEGVWIRKNWGLKGLKGIGTLGREA